MTKRKLSKGLQIYLLKKSIRKKLRELYPNWEFDIDGEIMDHLDFEALVDKTLDYNENFENILRYIEQNFGVSSEDHSYESEPIKYEEELKNFRETLRTEFNKEGYDLNEEQFESLLVDCRSLFSTKIPVSQVKSNQIVNSCVMSIVNLLKPQESQESQASKLSYLPNILVDM